MAEYVENVEEVTLNSQNEGYNNNGIALYSTEDHPNSYSGTEGSYSNQIRIKWMATDVNGSFGDNSGLTSSGWYNDPTEYPGSPLAEYSLDDIYNSVFGNISPGTLNEEFVSWANNLAISDAAKNNFVFNVLWPKGCVDVTWGSQSE